MGSTRRSTFVRQIVHADYFSDDVFLGSGSESYGTKARIYLEFDAGRRSKYIVGRLLAVVINAFVTVSLGVLAFGVVRMTQNLGDAVLASVLAALGCWFGWCTLKAQSWLRWMVRNWHAPIRTPHVMRGLRQKKRKANRTNRFRAPASLPTVRFTDVLDIAWTWFLHEFVRRYVRADYRPGDKLIVGYGPSGVLNRLVIAWYPEEYLSSGKILRVFMIISTLLPLLMALGIFGWLSPANFDQQDPPNQVDFFFMVIILLISTWVLLGTQSFLRWMVRNWKTPSNHPAQP